MPEQISLGECLCADDDLIAAGAGGKAEEGYE
jgi:hypothetical protein